MPGSTESTGDPGRARRGAAGQVSASRRQLKCHPSDAGRATASATRQGPARPLSPPGEGRDPLRAELLSDAEPLSQAHSGKGDQGNGDALWSGGGSSPGKAPFRPSDALGWR